jgi:hypothetical protein
MDPERFIERNRRLLSSGWSLEDLRQLNFGMPYWFDPPHIKLERLKFLK